MGEKVTATVKRSTKVIRKDKGRVNWERIYETTAREIETQIASDPGTAPIHHEEWFSGWSCLRSKRRCPSASTAMYWS